MDWNFRQQSDADIDRIAEAHYDRLWDRYWGTDEEDAWDHDNPGWEDIADLIDGFGWKKICGLMRDYVEGDADLMTAIYEAGLLTEYIAPEDGHKTKDPDTLWELIDSTFEAQWDNDKLFEEIYKWLPEEHIKKLAERLMENADNNGIREEYNDSRRE